ncbi:hypothetical protein FJZ27_01005 [Candidatus Peribacteria bacterium]|nr:hypothetical protein [Candidatus Peribacteria bacterium]
MNNDVERRVGEHNEGTDPKAYTFKRRPVTLVYVSDFGDIWQAIDYYLNASTRHITISTAT